ncbi:MAG TPA: DUF3341 domain-containing protein [Bacteroidales bacterium]|jgi:hypothetical protein|nr:DUF3341 domain-containing protein [Bacteroidales bacterium]
MAKNYKIGVFDSEDKFLSSLKVLIQQKYAVYETFTPYPIPEMLHMLKRKSRIPLAAYFFGLFGVTATLAFLYYTSVISWPIVYGGKPFNSFPSFVVVTIVITIFTVTVLSLGLFSARSKLIPGRLNTIFDHRATDDRFIIVVEESAAGLSMDQAAKLMQENGAVEILDKQMEKVLA